MERLKGTVVLVTGGTGLVGSHLVESLLAEEVQVIVPYRSLHPFSYFASQNLGDKTILAACDIKDADRVFDLLTKYEVEYIFHLAAQAIVPTAFHNPLETMRTNVMGTTNVLEAARRYPGVKGVIIASSDKAYGKTKKKYLESDPLKGDHPYEVSKSAADLIAQAYWKTYQLPVVITRFGNIYGEGDLNFSRLIPGIMKAIIKKEVLKIRSDGSYVRDYVYVKDVMRGYIVLAENITKLKGEVFNFSSDETYSVLDVVKQVERILRKKVQYSILNEAKNEISYQSLDYKKVKKATGWQPKFSLKKTIAKIYSWYKSSYFNHE